MYSIANTTQGISVKGMIRRATTKCVLLAVILFWTTIITTSDEGIQPPTIIPEASGAKQRQVMDVDGMCKLLNTKRLRKGGSGWPSEKIIITTIEISMNEMCEKEKSFEGKAAPITETVDGKEFEIIYTSIRIEDNNINTVIESKHIQALHKFLQMFAGCRIEWLFINNKQMTQDKEELRKIRNTLETNPWVDMPISVKWLYFHSTNEANTAHPALLQVVLQAVKITEVAEEELNYIDISIAANHIQQAIQLLNGLRCKTLKHLYLRIKDEEQPPYEEAEKEPSLTQSEQEWKYDVEELETLLYYDNCSIILPAWLIRKPIRRLGLDMQLYMYLSKKEVESIRAQVLEVRILDETDQSNLESDIIRRKSEGITNEMVTELQLNYCGYFPKYVLTKEKTLECTRSCLTWAATQFPSLIIIDINDLEYLCDDYPDLFRDIGKMVVVFNPKMQSLQHVFLGRRPMKLLKNIDRQLRTMPFVICPKLCQAFTSGQMEVQINKQKNLKENQEEYIRMQARESDKNTEQFSCPICHEEFDKDDESSWIYVTWPCRHAFCVKCLNTCFKKRDPACTLDRISLPGDWRACWRIEKAENNTYSMILSSVKENNDGKVQIGEFEGITVVIKH